MTRYLPCLAHVLPGEHDALRRQQEDGGADGRSPGRINVFHAHLGEDGGQRGKEGGQQCIVFPHNRFPVFKSVAKLLYLRKGRSGFCRNFEERRKTSAGNSTFSCKICRNFGWGRIT